MKWVTDPSGRFIWRPYFTQEEIDTQCESTVRDFMKQKYGEYGIPISTEDLTILIERDVSQLDLYADLSGEGEDVDGVTDFFASKKPSVRISKKLSMDEQRHHRLRTALAHEYGHIKFHAFLWTSALGTRVNTLGEKLLQQRRKYETVLARLTLQNIEYADTDWMEWQASYAGEAVLMPVSRLKKSADGVLKEETGTRWLYENTDSGKQLVSVVSRSFDVAEESARSRLLHLGLLQNSQDSPSIKERSNAAGL